MDFITFIIGIGILIVVLNLRGRVQKLEQCIKGEATEHVPEPSYQPQGPQGSEPIPALLLDYMKELY